MILEVEKLFYKLLCFGFDLFDVKKMLRIINRGIPHRESANHYKHSYYAASIVICQYKSFYPQHWLIKYTQITRVCCLFIHISDKTPDGSSIYLLSSYFIIDQQKSRHF